MAPGFVSSSTRGFDKQIWCARLAWFERLLLWILRQGVVPRHLGVAPDGNRRSARLSGIGLRSAYLIMCEKMALMCQYMVALEVKDMSSGVFSNRNFLRDTEEVDAVLYAADEFSKTLLLSQCSLHQMRMGVSIVGDVVLLPRELQSNMAYAEIATSTEQSKRKYQLCTAYTSRSHFRNIMQHIANAVKTGVVKSEDITSELMRDLLTIMETSETELWFRSSGRQCFMEFLVLQSGYTYMHIEPKLWHSVGFWEFLLAILQFQLHWPHILVVKERHEKLHSFPERMDIEKIIRQRIFLRRMKSWRMAYIERFCSRALVEADGNAAKKRL